MDSQFKKASAHLGYLARIFVLAQNPELRLVSKQFYLASLSPFTRADYLLYKYGRDQLFSPTQGVFKRMPKIISENTTLALLGKIEFEEDKDNELFFYSIKNEWNEVVLKVLNTFIIKGPNKKLLEDSNTSEDEEIGTETANHRASIVAPAIDINKSNGKAIELALKQNNIEAAKLLLNAHKIIPSYKKTSYESYKIIAHKRADLSHVSYSITIFLLDKGQKEIIQLLVCEGENFRHFDTVFGRDDRASLEISKAVLGRCICNRIKYLINRALELSSVSGNIEVVKLILDYGTDITNIDDLLIRASENCHIEVVKMLLDHGADVHADKDLAFRNASENGHLEVVKLLLDHGADVHSENDSTLKWASQNGNFELVKLLLDYGADVHAYNDYSLRVASQRDYQRLVKLLLDYGADVHAYNDYCLRFASQRDYKGLVKLLIDYGADAHAQNGDALKWAKYFEHQDLCIRHLTTSTTDPGATKPDGFAIGSISKRDLSGSGDKAAPVYPVKHPTMSYAGTAKGRPAAQIYLTTTHKKQSTSLSTTGTLVAKNRNLKKLCMGGSECKIGCSWDQFGDNASGAVESICRQLFYLRMTMQYDRPSKYTYYIVKDEQAAERLLNGPLFYEGKKIEFFQTVHYEEEVMIITIPSFKDVQGETLFKAACKTLSKYGTVKDASARFVRGTSTMVPFGMKILFAKSSEKDMPNFIKVQKSRVGMFWRGCTPSCNYCKKYGHWKSECPEILQKNQNKKSQKQKTQPKNMTTKIPIQREISDVEPKSANVATNKSESAKDADIQSSKKLATKTKAEATKSSTSANIQQINTEVALSNTAELMQQQTSVDKMEVELFLNEVKQEMTAEIASNPESAGLKSPTIINITGDLADGTASIATDTVHATVNTASTVAYNGQSPKGDTGHEKIE
ncbi:hypothetical protein BB560_001096, partial [Smittium megazygosporum]